MSVCVYTNSYLAISIQRLCKLWNVYTNFVLTSLSRLGGPLVVTLYLVHCTDSCWRIFYYYSVHTCALCRWWWWDPPNQEAQDTVTYNKAITEFILSTYSMVAVAATLYYSRYNNYINSLVIIISTFYHFHTFCIHWELLRMRDFMAGDLGL